MAAPDRATVLNAAGTYAPDGGAEAELTQRVAIPTESQKVTDVLPVLQRFRGELQMLDSRQGGGQSDYGGGGGNGQQRERVGAMDPRSPAPGPGGNDDLDDEIPF